MEHRTINILVYTEKRSARLDYVLEEILGRRLGLKYGVVTGREEYLQAALPGICYGEKPVRPEKEIFIPAAGLLWESGTESPQPRVETPGDVPVLFPVADKGDFPFDLFSAFFFMLTRYEEYLPFDQDAHGRFPAASSLAFRHGFLDIPVADRWVMMLEKKLKSAFPGIRTKEKEVLFLPTFDVDQVFAVKEKPFFRYLAGCVKSRDFSGRRRIRRGEEPDPFDTFAAIRRLHEPRGLKPFFFFHAGTWGKYDKSISPVKDSVSRVIRECDSWGRVGLHPSYRSNEKPELLFREKERLERVLGHPVIAARQHFIRLRFPSTYRRLLEAGIREDYSMGFPEMPGFRAGTAFPFRWFDPERDEVTPLTVYPFVVMDGALRNMAGENREQSLAVLKDLYEKTEATGGRFIQLWHNHSLGEKEGWQGWRVLYEKWLAVVTNKE